jgi:hypothetical protein
LLEEDLEESSRDSGVTPQAYIEGMREHFGDLLPSDRRDSPAASHLSSVLLALSNLKKHRGHATRSIS